MAAGSRVEVCFGDERYAGKLPAIPAPEPGRGCGGLLPRVRIQTSLSRASVTAAFRAGNAHRRDAVPG